MDMCSRTSQVVATSTCHATSSQSGTGYPKDNEKPARPAKRVFVARL